ncbi:hypothetical protein CYMTET_5889 [Cymbomonas tetramitiformis]|uniref:Uncharacterized protein n=1 Tax=Cymbomonas tetramitiformis TaxID=36881 RepID=A0AAE0LIM1_9CHLO|nr:hypothetical protein CYMTET_5889 [Cymbomonas tetramitiformis]
MRDVGFQDGNDNGSSLENNDPFSLIAVDVDKLGPSSPQVKRVSAFLRSVVELSDSQSSGTNFKDDLAQARKKHYDCELEHGVDKDAM